MSDIKYQRIENMIDRIIFSTERDIEERYKVASDELKKVLADLYEQHGELTNETMNKYNRLFSLEERMNEVTQAVYAANRKEINKVLRQTFVETSKSLITIANDETGKSLQPITKSKKVTEVINSKVQNLSWRDRLGKHQGDVMYELKKEIGAGIERGETYGELAKRIQKTFDVDQSKAMTIARNETARVKSASEVETMDKISNSGVQMVKTWNNVLDERSRGYRESDTTNHMALDGVSVPYEDEFKLGGGVKTEAPRLSGVARHDINCRCFLSYSFKEE